MGKATAEAKLWTYRDTASFSSAAKLHDLAVSELVAPCATAGDAPAELHSRIVALHRTMREAYEQNISDVGHNIYPLIVARDTAPAASPTDRGRQGVGGVYTLYLADGSTQSVQPTPRAYEMLKCLSHMPLGLFSLLSPYLRNPTATAWVSALSAYQQQVDLAVEALEHGADTLDPEHRRWASEMLAATARYVETTLQRKSLSVDAFQDYTAELKPYLRTCMDAAAKLQVDAVTKTMMAWRDMLGPEQWDKLYVIVPTIWPVAENSPRWQIFRSLMNPERVDTHLLTGEGVRTDEEARILVGRIVADRLAGRLILGTSDERAQRMTQCISSRTDVVSDSAYQALKEFASGCPVHPNE